MGSGLSWALDPGFQVRGADANAPDHRLNHSSVVELPALPSIHHPAAAVATGTGRPQSFDQIRASAPMAAKGP